MDYLDTTHACPLCRASFRHLPAVCVPLHSYLVHRYPTEMTEREEETTKREKEEFYAESPAVPKSSDDDLDVRNAFVCLECNGLAVPPMVLTCGHVVCRGSSERVRQNQSCPVEGCFGKMTTPKDKKGKSSTPAVCAAIDAIIRDCRSQEEYEEAALASIQQCRGLRCSEDTSSAAVVLSDGTATTDTFSPDDLVTIHGLTSSKGALMNGHQAKVISYCASTGQCTITIPSMQGFQCQVKAQNLQRAESSNAKRETYVNYGVGCDGCGACPIIGRRYKCKDCSEEIGFDLCGNCYDGGVHKRDAGAGRFNQQHKPHHTMEEMDQTHTMLHEIQSLHPNTPLSHIVQMINMQEGDEEEDGEEEADADTAAVEDTGNNG